MKIRFLELENFKSYCGTHRIGPFEDGVSCIIGPNGCGKSNVLDSLLFIFGFKSEKLRQDNLKSLIHRSSAAFASSCRVSVILETKEGHIKITRAISESGYSYYYLNDSKSTLDTLKGVLFEHGIDLRTNHFMILQGEIEKLAELGSKELLAHMEYLFGSQPYIEEINQLESRYQQLQISHHTFHETLKIKRKSLTELQESRNRALSWVKYHIQAIRCESMILTTDIKHYTEKGEGLSSELAAVEQELQSEASRQVGYRSHLRELDEKLVAQERQLKLTKTGYKKMEEEYNGLKLKLISLKTNLEFKQKDFTAVYNKKEDLKDQMCKLKSVDAVKQVPVLRAQLAEYQKEMDSHFDTEKARKLNAVAKKRNDLANMKDEHELNQKELESLRVTLKEASQQHQQLALLQREREQTNSEIKAQLNILSNRVLKSKENIASYDQTLLQLRTKIDDMTSTRNVDSVANHLAKEIKKASENGVLKGLHGRLREYCWVETKYQRAFHTVCPQLDYYIADTYDSALAATNYLKGIRLGRATFVVLEQLAVYPDLERAMKSRFAAPAGSQRLFDLVQGDTFRNVLYWSIQDTLVTEDLQQAVEIAYGSRRHRVVTLKGDFIDISGTMTSAPPAKSIGTEDLESLKCREKLIDKLLTDEKAKLQKQEEQLNQKKRLLEAVNTKRALLSDDSGIKAQSYSLQEIQFIRRKVEVLEKNKAKLESTIGNIQPELQRLSEGINKLDIDTYIKLKANIDLVKAKLKAIESSDNTIGKLQGRVDAEQAKESALQTEMDKLVSEQEQLQTRINLLDLRLEESVSDITHGELELSQLKQQIKSLHNKLKSTASHSCSEKLQKLRQQIEKTRVDRSKAEEALKINEQQMGEYRESAIEDIRKLAESDSSRMLQSQLTMTQNNRCVVLRKDFEVMSQAINPDYKDARIHLSLVREKLLAVEKEGVIDLAIIEKFNEANAQLINEESQLAQMKQQADAVGTKIQHLKEQRLKTFQNGFSIVCEAVKGIYHELTKGDIDLSLVDALDPFSSGVELTVRPANKTWKQVNLLSGGEKTMTALALTFAFSRIRYCPFYLMDEIDAALDYRNTGILAKYIKNRQSSQMVVISLRRNMYEQAASLTGVYKINNCSRTLTVKVSDLEYTRNCAIDGVLEEQVDP